jgi:hypothetical protein
MPTLSKLTHIRPWDAPSPLAVKWRRLDADPEDMLDDTPETAFNGCLRMSPGVEGERFGAAFSQKLSIRKNLKCKSATITCDSW